MTSDKNIPYHRRPYHRWLVWCLIGLTLFRLVAMINSPVGLHGDEAQYWAWSKNLDWGYFTKPPMIAWVIATTTALFGDAEWAVRLSSPLIHPITAYVIFRTARFVYDDRTGFWAALLYFLMPALWLSSGIVSTDVPLLLCWATALNAWVHLRDRASWPRAIQLGIAFGLGMMSKYAMLFFLPALGLAFIFDPKTRRGLNNIKGYMAGLIGWLIVAPNIWWNITHDFATLSHTAANANIQGELPFHPDEFFTFWADQLAVFGPITLVLLLIAVIAALKGRLASPNGWIAAFVISPLLIISIEALISRANANWAITAYVAAPILIAHWGLERGRHIWSKSGVMLNTVLGAALVIVGLSPALTNALGLANSVKRVRAWPETVTALQDRIAGGHEGQEFTMVAMDKRVIFYSLHYYGLGETRPLKMWMAHSGPDHHAELTAPLPAQHGPVLVVNYHADKVDEMDEDFDRLIPLPPLDIDLGGGKRRKLNLWAGYGYTPTTTR